MDPGITDGTAITVAATIMHPAAITHVATAIMHAEAITHAATAIMHAAAITHTVTISHMQQQQSHLQQQQSHMTCSSNHAENFINPAAGTVLLYISH